MMVFQKAIHFVSINRRFVVCKHVENEKKERKEREEREERSHIQVTIM